MNKDLATVHLLINFANIDDHLDPKEISAIKSILSKLSINLDTDSILKKAVDQKDSVEIEEYSKAIHVLNQELKQDEKIRLLKKCVEVIEADGKIMDSELTKLHMVCKNWQIDVKMVL